MMDRIARAARAPTRALIELGNRPLGLSGRPLRKPFSTGRPVSGRVVLVTGASSGIGEATARAVGAAGGVVLLVARRAEKLVTVRAEIEAAGGVAHVHPCDLTNMEAIDRLAAEVLEQHGHVDVLVNNAGISIRRSIALSYDRFHDFERTIQLNYLAPVRLVLALMPSMRERRSGHIVNISSAGVPTRTPRFSAYIASKAALDAFSDCVQAEVVSDGVHFTTIHMPLVRTPMIAPTGIYKRFPALTPDQAADMVMQAMMHRPRRMGPPFGALAAFADAVSPEAMDLVRNRGYRLFPDSRAARGEKPGGEEPVSRTGEAFANVARGVHW